MYAIIYIYMYVYTYIHTYMIMYAQMPRLLNYKQNRLPNWCPKGILVGFERTGYVMKLTVSARLPSGLESCCRSRGGLELLGEKPRIGPKCGQVWKVSASSKGVRISETKSL